MNKNLYILLTLLGILVQNSFAQYKAEQPDTYQQMCYYSINKEKFTAYKTVKEAVLAKKYKIIYPILREMRSKLKSFDITHHNRAFEIWYIGNYTDFEQQVNSAIHSTENFIKNYENRLRKKEALYYDHRMFLEQYLAFVAENFYQEFWFMSMERYFSNKTVERIKNMNKKEGFKLFQNSEFFRPFNIFNDLARSEETEIKDYLDLDKVMRDSTTFIPYSYVVLDKHTAIYILEHFVLDDATQDIDTDRQVSALRKMLKAVIDDKALFVGRLNLIELRRLQQKKKEESADIPKD